MEQRKILIVEDDEILREALQAKMQLEGFDVLIAKNGKEGLSTAINECPNLIVLDVIMPEMDGLTMLQKLRKDSWGKSVPVIILTNKNADDLTVNQVISDHPSYYLIKSNLEMNDIFDKIKEVLK